MKNETLNTSLDILKLNLIFLLMVDHYKHLHNEATIENALNHKFFAKNVTSHATFQMKILKKKDFKAT